jgi:hypothetical protein
MPLDGNRVTAVVNEFAEGPVHNGDMRLIAGALAETRFSAAPVGNPR